MSSFMLNILGLMQDQILKVYRWTMEPLLSRSLRTFGLTAILVMNRCWIISIHLVMQISPYAFMATAWIRALICMDWFLLFRSMHQIPMKIGWLETWSIMRLSRFHSQRMATNCWLISTSRRLNLPEFPDLVRLTCIWAIRNLLMVAALFLKQVMPFITLINTTFGTTHPVRMLILWMVGVLIEIKMRLSFTLTSQLILLVTLPFTRSMEKMARRSLMLLILLVSTPIGATTPSLSRWIWML